MPEPTEKPAEGANRGPAKDERTPAGFESTVDQDAWERIGFQRSLGGFFYSIMIAVFSTIVGVFFLGWITALLYPYPEIQGYGKVAGGFFFALVYRIFDFGTAYGISRFVAEYRVKDPQKMLEYIQFFVWFQLMTGIVQVTVISFYVLWALVDTQYAYLAWIFLIICQKQWPGMLGTFKSVLDGMQLYNKTNILTFISGDVFQNLTNVAFILLGRYWGQQNPAVGDLMGAVIGSAVGAYVDDFFAMWLSSHYLAKVTKQFGFTARDFWRWGFSKDVAKRCLWFGLQVSVVPIINSATGVYMMLLYLEGMPQYTTWIALRDVAGGITGIVNVGSFGLTPIIAESYMNKKEDLAAFYITAAIRWNGFLMWMLTAVLISFLPMVLAVLLSLPELVYYAPAQAFLIPLLIHTLFRPFVDFPNGILIGTERVTFYTFVRVFEEVLQVFFIWLFLYGVRLQEVWGIFGIVFILSFEHFFPRLIKMVMCWVYIRAKLFPIRINWWQTLLGPIVCSTVVFGFGYSWYLFVFTPLVGLIGILPTAAVTLAVGLVIIPFLFYLPLTGLLGLWDDFSMETFRRAVDLAGPSKWLVSLFYKATAWGVRHSRLHNRFKIPWETANRQIQELMDMKRSSEARLYEKRISNAPWLKQEKRDS